MDVREVFGLVLRRVRKEKGLSQEKLALDAELDRAHISKLENGAYQPNLSTLFDLAKILECRPGYLVDLVDDELKKST